MKCNGCGKQIDDSIAYFCDKCASNIMTHIENQKEENKYEYGHNACWDISMSVAIGWSTKHHSGLAIDKYGPNSSNNPR